MFQNMAIVALTWSSDVPLRRSITTDLLKAGTDIPTVQELLGPSDASTTMIYLHELNVAVGGKARSLGALGSLE